MAAADLASMEQSATAEWPLANPWPWVIASLACTSISFLLAWLFGGHPEALRLMLVFTGVFAGLAAVVIRPGAVGVLAGAALTSFIASWALLQRNHLESWNSIRWFLAMGALVAIVAAAIVALPKLWRRVAFSAVILLHFGGILTAVLVMPPGPWLANLMWVSVYRPYLQLMYLTNAYHFYAPNPGNSYFFWFRVAYSLEGDTTSRWQWINVPDIDDDGWPNYALALRYQRHISLATLVAQNTQIATYPRLGEIYRRHEAANLARYKAGSPIFPLAPGRAFYAEPTPTGARILRSYVRHVAKDFARSHPDAAIRDIKVYRVEHIVLNAAELARGEEPQDPYSYLPYYWGDFDSSGRMIDRSDPFLYFLMPILRVKPGHSTLFAPNEAVLKPLVEHLRDYLKSYLEQMQELKQLLPKPPVTAKKRAAFQKEHPELARIAGGLLEISREREKMLEDIARRLARSYENLPDHVAFMARVDDISSLVGKYPGLVTDLIQHRKALVEAGKGTVEQAVELGRALELWASGRLRVQRDDEDHFDIAVATATNLPEGDPMILNYAYLHAGDPKWVRFPGKAEWEAPEPLPPPE